MVLITKEQLNDPNFEWCCEMFKGQTWSDDGIKTTGNISFLQYHPYNIYIFYGVAEYINLASLMLGSHHANFMKPFTGLQVQFKKTTDRIGIIVLVIDY